MLKAGSIGLIGALALWTTTAVAAQSTDISTETIAKAKTSIVPIACVTSNSTDPVKTLVQGTGTLLNSAGDVLTAAHVAAIVSSNSLQPRGNCIYKVYVPETGWANVLQQPFNSRYFSIGACESDAASDIAVCHLLENPFNDAAIRTLIAPMSIRRSGYSDGAPIAFTGFPLLSISPFTSKGDVAAQHTTTSIKYNEGVLSLSNVLVMDRAAWPGASGSPIYSEDGSMVAMLVGAGTDAGAGLCYGIPAADLSGFLTAHKIQFRFR